MRSADAVLAHFGLGTSAEFGRAYPDQLIIGFFLLAARWKLADKTLVKDKKAKTASLVDVTDKNHLVLKPIMSLVT